MDSACTKQTCNQRRCFSVFTEVKAVVQAGNVGNVQFSGYGNARAETILNGNSHNVVFHNLLHAPDTMYNLFSVSRLRLK